jgi:hypothetical protein
MDKKAMKDVKIDTIKITKLKQSHRAILNTVTIIKQIDYYEQELGKLEALSKQKNWLKNKTKSAEMARLITLKVNIENNIKTDVQSLYNHVEYLEKLHEEMDKAESFEIRDSRDVEHLISDAKNMLAKYNKQLLSHAMVTKQEWNAEKGIFNMESAAP